MHQRGASGLNAPPISPFAKFSKDEIRKTFILLVASSWEPCKHFDGSVVFCPNKQTNIRFHRVKWKQKRNKQILLLERVTVLELSNIAGSHHYKRTR